MNDASSFMTLKKGYRLIITSWENDGDCYATRVIDGLSHTQTQVYVDIAKLFTKSYHQSGEIQYYGNICYDEFYEFLEPLVEDVKSIFDKYKNIDSDAQERLNIINQQASNKHAFDAAISSICNSIYGNYSDFFKTRVVEKITVVYIPQNIIFGNCTSEFV